MVWLVVYTSLLLVRVQVCYSLLTQIRLPAYAVISFHGSGSEQETFLLDQVLTVQYQTNGLPTLDAVDDRNSLHSPDYRRLGDTWLNQMGPEPMVWWHRSQMGLWNLFWEFGELKAIKRGCCFAPNHKAFWGYWGWQPKMVFGLEKEMDGNVLTESSRQTHRGPWGYPMLFLWIPCNPRKAVRVSCDCIDQLFLVKADFTGFGASC